MATYSVNVLGNNDGMQTLRTVTAKLEGSLQALTGSASQFKAVNTGHAIDSYDQAQILWNQGMGEMQTALNTMGLNLGRITENYVNTDVQGSGLFGR